MQKLSARFPTGLSYLVQYDSTTFVTDTIAEVLKTLGEAFVLVVIVVLRTNHLTAEFSQAAGF